MQQLKPRHTEGCRAPLALIQELSSKGECLVFVSKTQLRTAHAAARVQARGGLQGALGTDTGTQHPKRVPLFVSIKQLITTPAAAQAPAHRGLQGARGTHTGATCLHEPCMPTQPLYLHHAYWSRLCHMMCVPIHVDNVSWDSLYVCMMRGCRPLLRPQPPLHQRSHARNLASAFWAGAFSRGARQSKRRKVWSIAGVRAESEEHCRGLRRKFRMQPVWTVKSFSSSIAGKCARYGREWIKVPESWLAGTRHEEVGLLIAALYFDEFCAANQKMSSSLTFIRITHLKPGL
eukprot:scaffold169055_cov19-Tisochrysis_lutea.AAC.1